MSKSLYIGNASVARKSKKGYIGNSSVARTIKKGYVGSGGVAHQFFSPGGDGPSSYKYYLSDRSATMYALNMTETGYTKTIIFTYDTLPQNFRSASMSRLVIYNGRIYGYLTTYDYGSSTSRSKICSLRLSDLSDYKESPELMCGSEGYYFGSGGYGAGLTTMVVSDSGVYFVGRYSAASDYEPSARMAGFVMKCPLGSDNSIGQSVKDTTLWDFHTTARNGMIQFLANPSDPDHFLVNYYSSSYYGPFSSDYNCYIRGVGSSHTNGPLCMSDTVVDYMINNGPYSYNNDTGNTEYSRLMTNCRTGQYKYYTLPDGNTIRSSTLYAYNDNDGEYGSIYVYQPRSSSGSVFGKSLNYKDTANMVFTILQPFVQPTITLPSGHYWQNFSSAYLTSMYVKGVLYIKALDQYGYWDGDNYNTANDRFILKSFDEGQTWTLMDEFNGYSGYYQPSSAFLDKPFFIDSSK